MREFAGLAKLSESRGNAGANPAVGAMMNGRAPGWGGGQGGLRSPGAGIAGKRVRHRPTPKGGHSV